MVPNDKKRKTTENYDTGKIDPNIDHEDHSQLNRPGKISLFMFLGWYTKDRTSVIIESF